MACGSCDYSHLNLGTLKRQITALCSSSPLVLRKAPEDLELAFPGVLVRCPLGTACAYSPNKVTQRIKKKKSLESDVCQLAILN